jgi:hypothetical protein
MAALRPLERDAQSNAMNTTLTMAQIVDCADMIKCFYAPGRVLGNFPAKTAQKWHSTSSLGNSFGRRWVKTSNMTA